MRTTHSFIARVLMMGFYLSITPPIRTLGADEPPPAAGVPSIKLLSSRVATLEKQLAEANVRCQQLQDQNAALMKRLNSAPSAEFIVRDIPGVRGVHGEISRTRPVSDDLPPRIIPLVAPDWGENSKAKPQQLDAGISGTSLNCVPYNESIATLQDDPTHLTILAHTTSKGLGIAKDVIAAKLWMERGGLYVHWLVKENSVAVGEALQYSILNITQENGRLMKIRFSEPAAINAKLSDAILVKLPIPISVAQSSKFDLVKIPAGWTAVPAEDGTSITISKGDDNVRVIMDATVPSIRVVPSSPLDSDVQERRLQRATQQLLDEKAQRVDRAFNTDGRGESQYARDKQRKEQRIKDADITLTQVRRDWARSKERAKVFAELGGAKLRLLLPNSVESAVVNLSDQN